MLKVEVYKTPNCQNCDKVKELLEKLKEENFPAMEIEIKNLLERQDLISKHQIFSSPGVFINGEFAFSGGASEQQLKDFLNKKN